MLLNFETILLVECHSNSNSIVLVECDSNSNKFFWLNVIIIQNQFFWFNVIQIWNEFLCLLANGVICVYDLYFTEEVAAFEQKKKELEAQKKTVYVLYVLLYVIYSYCGEPQNDLWLWVTHL